LTGCNPNISTLKRQVDLDADHAGKTGDRFLDMGDTGGAGHAAHGKTQGQNAAGQRSGSVGDGHHIHNV
jgi:hypothetical protein